MRIFDRTFTADGEAGATEFVDLDFERVARFQRLNF